MELVGTKEAARRLGVSVRRVQQLITNKKLAAQQVGRDFIIDARALDKVKVYGKPGRPPSED